MDERFLTEIEMMGRSLQKVVFPCYVWQGFGELWSSIIHLTLSRLVCNQHSLPLKTFHYLRSIEMYIICRGRKAGK